jgi:trk system potassium uptake protein TrkA
MRVVLVGGGNVGTYIARELHKGGHEVLIVEVDPNRVAQAVAQGEPEGVTWLQADACEVSEFVKAEPNRADVVVAVTGDDEDNLVISLLAKQEFGVPRVVAILRQDRVVVPRGDTVLYSGDEVLVLVSNESEDDVRTILVG